MEAVGYDPEADLENPTGSVFCAHGAGFVVNWDQVEDYMHVESGWNAPAGQETKPEKPVTAKNWKEENEKYLATEKELEEIFERTYGPVSYTHLLNRSYLMHLFRDETGYTIGKYITEKRLYLANHAIEQGVSVTDACYQSGFRNYTTFYQAYRNKYHKSPKQARK